MRGLFGEGRLKIIIALIWLIFTVSLVSWWGIFAYGLLVQTVASDAKIAQGVRMLFAEGGSLILLVLAGGVALVVYSYRDGLRAARLGLFFATFSHDIKTSIARLRLQSDVLMEDVSFQNHPVLQRLVADLGRLDLQLENSLWISDERPHLRLENLSLNEVISELRSDFPEVEVRLSHDVFVRADKKALGSVVRNIFHNSIHHGKASLIHVTATGSPKQYAAIEFSDNGVGSTKDLTQVGQAPLVIGKRSGAGVGLYLIGKLAAQMGGQLKLTTGHGAFKVLVQLPAGKKL